MRPAGFPGFPVQASPAPIAGGQVFDHSAERVDPTADQRQMDWQSGERIQMTAYLRVPSARVVRDYNPQPYVEFPLLHSIAREISVDLRPDFLCR